MKKKTSLLLAVTLVLSLSASVKSSAYENIIRLSGKDRYETSVNVAKRYFTSSDTVIVANGEKFVDSLVGGQLAMAEKAPILFSKTDSMPETVSEEIKSLNPSKIYILGGVDSISVNMEKKLSNIATVERFGGDSRYETAEKIVEKTKSVTSFRKVALVSATDFPDALSSSSYLYSNGYLMMISDGHSKPDYNVELVIGGKKSLPLPWFSKERIAGDDRYTTSLMIADRMKSPLVAVTSGISAPDALSCISIASQTETSVFLMPEKNTGYLVKKLSDLKPSKIVIVGGEKYITPSLEKDLGLMMKNSVNTGSGSG